MNLLSMMALKSSSKNSDSRNRAFSAALALLARQDYSLASLRTKLEKKGFSGEESSLALQRLVELNYLDDHRLAKRLAESSAASGRGVGFRLIQELCRRGIPRELAEEAEQAVRGETDQVQVVRQLLIRRYPSLAAESDPGLRRRAIGYLQRRGFSFEVIQTVLHTPLTEGHDDW